MLYKCIFTIGVAIKGGVQFFNHPDNNPEDIGIIPIEEGPSRPSSLMNLNNSILCYDPETAEVIADQGIAVYVKMTIVDAEGVIVTIPMTNIYTKCSNFLHLPEEVGHLI